LRRGLLWAQRGDDKARIGRAAGPFRLADHATLTAPAVARRPGEFVKPARRLTGGFAVLLGRGEFGSDLSDQALVLGQAKQIIDPIGLAPTHQSLAGKPRSVGLQPTGLTRGAQRNAHFGPAGADLGDDAGGFLHL